VRFFADCSERLVRWLCRVKVNNTDSGSHSSHAVTKVSSTTVDMQRDRFDLFCHTTLALLVYDWECISQTWEWLHTAHCTLLSQFGIYSQLLVTSALVHEGGHDCPQEKSYSHTQQAKPRDPKCFHTCCFPCLDNLTWSTKFGTVWNLPHIPRGV